MTEVTVRGDASAGRPWLTTADAWQYRGIGVWFWDPAWVEAAYRGALAALEKRLRE